MNPRSARTRHRPPRARYVLTQNRGITILRYHSVILPQKQVVIGEPHSFFSAFSDYLLRADFGITPFGPAAQVVARILLMVGAEKSGRVVRILLVVARILLLVSAS